MTKTTLKVHKRFSTARKQSTELPIIKVGNLYITGADDLTEIAILDNQGRYNGNVIPKHLKRLGNANWAIAGDSRGFAKELK